jgi:hypothetical protein
MSKIDFPKYFWEKKLEKLNNKSPKQLKEN